MVQKPSLRVGRRLSAILAADVAGYSRLMHADEEATHARLTALLADGIEPAIAEHGGRIVKTTGDGFLAEFPSAVEAVRSAIHFQNNVRELTIDEADDKRLVFRVGINIGDIIVEANDIFGDGVNIAARLEGICEPGGICLSFSAYDQVRGKVEVEFTDLGEQNLKNITRPVRAYAVVRDGLVFGTRKGGTLESSPSAPPLSIVVLPFANIGGDPEQDYFVDGVTESLTTDLSLIVGAFVIARNTAFTFKGKVVDVKRIGRELNVRYALEGSVQRSGSRMRVNVQLIDTETGNHLWAERFDKPLADLFDMQDEIVSRLSNALDVRLMVAAARRAANAPHPSSMDAYFQGRAYLNKGATPEYLARAQEAFARSLALDPRNAAALAGASLVDAAIGTVNFTDDRATRLAAAEAAAIKAVSLAPDHAPAHLALGVAYIITDRAAQGIAECEQALALDRNLTDAYAFIGWGKLFLGRATETEGHILEALRLSPRDISAFRWMAFAGVAKLLLGADAEAVAWLRRSIEANRNFSLAHFHLAAGLALLGSLVEARAAVQAGLELDPNFNLHRFRASAASSNPTYLADRERIIEGMGLAGVPEG
ncbi:adenylate/guanylate cyclase domain-containing protein [Bradyrhizobium sp. AUGA SZCCT0283]|uniref:adenylate/guanylate cyclase domain-containing protein n=1 Tax=Bradyrhizobium sp. AUGA SZCCT0283 TaxID=2807671 RepID=UPI001BADAFA4|nr:adenylate/guanylate cyclase domain-containing protein [Bradyrhizobium sp. AUGA SZCCT0283]MBR1280181.1 adenylate/guanylate cyclase domain-containing protein [Bradyrhizobium sp. AUGA SZCCT0283]